MRAGALLSRLHSWIGVDTSAWRTIDAVHRVPSDRADHRTIDDHRVCDAVEDLERHSVAESARRLALLGEPSRLSRLIGMRAGPISVSDLAFAVDLPDARVSQILRLLRAEGAVSAQRDGRVVRYHLTDPTIEHILDALAPGAHETPHEAAALPPSG